MLNPDDYAFCETLYLSHYNSLFNYVCSLTNNADIAADIVADTFAKVIANVKKYRNYYNVRTALKTTAYNIFYDRNQNIRNERMTFEEYYFLYFSDAIQDVEYALAQSEQTKSVIDALNRLDESDKQIIQLCYCYKYNLKIISKLLNIRYHTIVYRHQNALKLLRINLGGDIDLTDSNTTPPRYQSLKPKNMFLFYTSYLMYIIRR